MTALEPNRDGPASPAEGLGPGLARFWTAHRGVLFNLLFAGYALVAQAWVSRSMEARFQEGRRSLVLGLLIFLVSLAEGAALRPKIRAVLELGDGRRLTPDRVAVFFMGPLFFRTLLGLMMAAAVFGMVMPDLRQRSTLGLVAAAMAVILILKELYVLFGGLFLLLKPRPRRIGPLREGLCDLSLLAFGCLAYSVLTHPGFFLSTRSSEGGLSGALAFLIFLWSLLSLRLAYLLEEYLRGPSALAGLAAPAITALLAAGCAAWPYLVP